MHNSIPEFGVPIEGAVYTLRPGGYGLIRDKHGHVAVVKTSTGLFLPGGGQESDESPEEALVREVQEECGLVVHIGQPLGIADQFAHSASEQIYYRKRCSFFTAHVLASKGSGSEPDHELLWLAPEDAAAQLRHESQRWIVIQVCCNQLRE
jgi:8-oxo-dGTP diphosphatase